MDTPLSSLRAPRTDGPLTRLLVREPGGFGLGQVPASRRPEATTRLTCGFCSTGCSLDVHLVDGKAVGLTPTADHPVNLGMACPKGWEALTPLTADDRATSPLLRDDHGRLVPVDWDTALDTFVTRMRAVQAEHGPASAAFLSTGQITTEEMALLGLVAKVGMGMVHGDGNTRQCMATSVAAHTQSFGFDAPPYTYADFEESDVIVLIGSNLCVTHPIMWERIARNPHHPEIVVVDPRRTETAMAATTHLALRPKSDLSLLYGLANRVVALGLVDERFVEAHTTGAEGYVEHVAAFTPERVSAESGIDPDRLEHVARRIGEGRAVSLWWTMGVNQGHQAVRTAQAVIALALLTGNVGRPGTGANSITGQCNAMGSRMFSNTASLYCGRDTTDPADRAEVAAVLGIDESRIPSEKSWAYDRIVEGIHRGEIRALWIVATNTAHSWINQSDVHELLDRLDLLVVQDMYDTSETAQRADLVLPAAGWGEKLGTFINSERRLGLVSRVAHAPGEALDDFTIFRLLAERWGCADLVAEWRDPEAAFAILQRLSAGRPNDITGVRGYADVAGGDLQWPCTVDDREAIDADRAAIDADRATIADRGAGSDPVGVERRLFADGRFPTPDGRARFVWEEPVDPPEVTDPTFPLVLLTGRGSASQWHTGTRTTKSSTLRALATEDPYVEIHPDDAAARGITGGEWVVLRSRRGSVRVRAHVVPTVQPGQVFVPMHDRHTNRLTFPAFDPHSRQPSYKHAAVEVARPEPWER